MNAVPDTADFAPASIEAEQALLGCILLNNDAFYSVCEIVEAEHFSEVLHGKLWEIVVERLARGETLTPLTISASLGKDAAINLGSGMTLSKYVARMAAEGVTVGRAAPDYAKTIRDLWTRRRVIALARDLMEQAMGGLDGASTETLLDEAGQELDSIRFGKQIDGVFSLDEAAKRAVDYTAKAYAGTVDIGVTTGIGGVDTLTGPLMPGDMVTMLGASGNGKSALVAHILKHNASPSLDAHAGNRRSLFFSMEMEGVQVARRYLAGETGITTGRQKSASITAADFEFLTDAARRIGPLPIMFDETPAQTMTRITRKSRALKRRYADLSIIAIDHLLEIRPDNPRWGKIETVENAVRELKRLAKELQVVVVLLAQATREGQKREHWRLRTSDIWGGDAVKQSSDIVLSLAIPTVWLADREPDPADRSAYDKWFKQTEEWQGRAEIGAPKVRDGQSGGFAKVQFDGARALFSDL